MCNRDSGRNVAGINIEILKILLDLVLGARFILCLRLIESKYFTHKMLPGTFSKEEEMNQYYTKFTHAMANRHKT
jgi:hypothetical protein